MRIAVKNGTIYVKDCDATQFNLLRGSGLMRYSKKDTALVGDICMELLDRIANVAVLPSELEQQRIRMHGVKDAVDRERKNEDPKPLCEYPVKATMYKHQIRGANMALLTFGFNPATGDFDESKSINKGFAVLADMGLGKGMTAISVAGVLYKLGKIRRMLVVAPSSVCAVWSKELGEHAAFPYRCALLLGTKQQRLKSLDALSASHDDALNVAVINYEATWRDGVFEALAAYDADMIIADESQRIKTHNAEQSKAMHKLGDAARYKLILSGTPVQNHAIDLYSQYRFLDKTVFGTSFYAFRGRYCEMGGFNRKQIVGYRDLDDLIRREYSIAYRVTKDEALDLPEQTFEQRIVHFGEKERKLYDEIRRESYAELDSGDSVTAATVLTRLLRLQQLAGGFLQTDEATEPTQVFGGKLDALADIIEDHVIGNGRKLVVFCRFLPELNAVTELCGKLLQKSGLRVVSICGAVPQTERGEIVSRFQNDPKTAVFVGQIDTAGTGITLTAADTCVYYSTTFNYATYTQSLSRIHRIGQRNRCTYVHLITENTVDEMIMTALAKKEDLSKYVVDSWREFF